MKHILIISIIVLASLTANAQITKIELQATGLTCSMCSNAINKQLSKLKDVDSVRTDLNTNTFYIYLQSNNQLTPLDIKNSVEKTGFFVGALVIIGNISGLPVEQYVLLQPTMPNINRYQVMNKGYVTAKAYKEKQKEYAATKSYKQVDKNKFHLQPLSQ